MAKLPQSLLTVILPLCAATIGIRRPTTSASAFRSLSDPHPVNAQEAILNAFDKYRIVALGEAHALQEEHDFIQSLIRNPAFADKVNDVVVECGNALYQDILDRYIAGQDVPLAEVRQVWRNTTQSPYGPWNAVVYEQIFTSLREINQKLPAGKRLRLLAGDPPIDWSKVEGFNDAAIFLGHRDSHFATVVEQQVLARNRKALLIIGAGHLFKAQPRMKGLAVKIVEIPGGNAAPGQRPQTTPAPRRGNVTALLEESSPGSTLVITPHTGFGALAPELAHLNAELEPRLAAWPKPSLAFIKGTWLGALEANAIFPGFFGPDGKLRNPYAGVTIEEMVDAYLYLGPQVSLTRSNPSTETLQDQAYLAELNRRSQIMSGSPFDLQRLISPGKQYDAFPPMRPGSRLAPPHR